MATPFDKYLERLRQKKSSATTFNAYSRGASALTGTGNYIANKMSGLRLGNTSASARYAMQQQAQQQIGSQVGDLYGQAMQTETNRIDQLDTQIGGLQVQQEQYKKQQKAEKDAKKRGLLQTAGQVGGAALGALLAVPTGGLSVLAGASIGSGLGGAVGSVAGKAPKDYAEQFKA